MGKGNTCIKSVGDYLLEIPMGDKSMKFIYRGVSDADNHKLTSRAKRELISNETNIKSHFIEYHRQEIESFRDKQLDKHFERKISIFEILAILQHENGKTLLMDFSEDPLIGLFYAVKKNDDLDGMVYFADYKNSKQFLSISADEALEGDINNFERIILKEYDAPKHSIHQNTKLLFWSPPYDLRKRFKVHKSTFVLDIPSSFPSHYFKSIRICNEDKKIIRDELREKYQICSNNLYPDIHGFAENFEYEKKYKDSKKEIIKLLTNRKTTSALRMTKKYLKNHPDSTFGLYYLGLIKYFLFDYKVTIDIISKLIDKKGINTPSVFFLRGCAFWEEDKSDEAIRDLRKARKKADDNKQLLLIEMIDNILRQIAHERGIIQKYLIFNNP